MAVDNVPFSTQTRLCVVDSKSLSVLALLSSVASFVVH